MWDGASTSDGGDATTDVGGLPGGKGVAEGVGGCGGGVALGDGAWAGGDALGGGGGVAFGDGAWAGGVDFGGRVGAIWATVGGLAGDHDGLDAGDSANVEPTNNAKTRTTKLRCAIASSHTERERFVASENGGILCVYIYREGSWEVWSMAR